MNRDPDYLRDILEAIAAIETYVVGGRDQFDAETMRQDAVIRRMEIIGEATKHLSSGFRARHDDIEWSMMAGMRDVLIHDYGRVNLDTVWGVIERRLPLLRRRIEAILAQDGGRDPSLGGDRR